MYGRRRAHYNIYLLFSFYLSSFPLVFFSIPNESLGTILDSLLFAMRHHERDISETGHTTLLEILRKISNTQYADQFFASQSVKIFTVTLDVLTDLLHKSCNPFFFFFFESLFFLIFFYLDKSLKGD